MLPPRAASPLPPLPCWEHWRGGQQEPQAPPPWPSKMPFRPACLLSPGAWEGSGCIPTLPALQCWQVCTAPRDFSSALSVSGNHPAQPVMTTQKEECLWGRSVYTITSHGMRHETGSHEVVPTSPPVPAGSPGEHFCPARLLQLTGSLSGGLETSCPVRSCHIVGSLVLVW